MGVCVCNWSWKWCWTWRVCVVASTVLATVTATHLHNPDSAPLFDVGHHVLPAVPEGVVDILLAALVGAAAWTAVRHPARCAAIWPCFLRKLSILAFLRACAIALVVLPDPHPMCHVAKDPMTWWLRLWRFVSLQDLRTCGDGTISARTIVFACCVLWLRLVLRDTRRRACYIKAAAIAAVAMVAMVAARLHYTVDVIVTCALSLVVMAVV